MYEKPPISIKCNGSPGFCLTLTHNYEHDGAEATARVPPKAMVATLVINSKLATQVSDANFYGLAQGNARGAVPSSKDCWLTWPETVGPDPFTGYRSHAPMDQFQLSASSTDRRIIDKYSFREWTDLRFSLVKGKIVICDMTDTSVTDEAFRARALGSIMLNDTYEDVSNVVPLPASSLNPHDSDLVMSYLKSTNNPQATILKSEITEHNTAPVVASFSSRGPNNIAPEILKVWEFRDISAPGDRNLWSAYSPVASPSDNIHLFTLPCHSFALFSMETTAKHADAEFGYGAGHINPIKAVDPGLVYEATETII
ncbi:hypothetical protein NC653_022713 [Populus alba x Populus x berolinensis]|uniref:Uncharacterized protein n=1 Tax=Populus alba x Populus x berolinensis TaxID=444605 RepID=A0AAD6QBZ1_9ROSI|nr:hypothetical protein NC653_022713 [Populus alba x Populus x berolinensis]